MKGGRQPEETLSLDSNQLDWTVRHLHDLRRGEVNKGEDRGELVIIGVCYKT